MLCKGGEGGGEHSVKAATACSVFSALVSKYIAKDWIVDIGATHHMTSNLDMLEKIDTVPQSERRQVNLPTGGVVSVANVGTSIVMGGHTIENVLFVPEFKCNLLSVSQLTKELQCVAAFFPDFCILHDLSSGQVKGIGREDQGLYILKDGLELKGGLDCHNFYFSMA